jgi:hypothetical protein
MKFFSITQQLFSIKKIESYFNDEYFKNASFTYLRVRSKLGRISFDATVAKTVDDMWVSTSVWFMSFKNFL